MKLFLQTTWAKDRSVDGVELLLSSTKIHVFVRDSDELIGYGRAISDGVYRAILDDIVVDENYRKQGIGKLIMENLLEQLKGVEQLFLNTKPELEYFYEVHGFAKSKGLTMKMKL